VLQSSANPSGGPDPRTLDEVPAGIRHAADLVLDAGELPGVPSTVVDLREYEDTGGWAIMRAGAVDEDQVREAIEG
jgi:L-threonylcarbamoyladenylate synthase